MDWQPEQLDLGALGFAGICRETFRELLGAIVPNKGGRGTAILSVFFLVQIAAHHAFHCLLDAFHGSDLVHGEVAFAPLLLFISKAVCIFLLFVPSLISPAAFAFRVASPYCTDGDAGPCYRILRDLPRAPLARLAHMSLHVIPPAISYTLFTMAACLVILLLDPSNEVVILPLRLIGAAACFAGAAYGSVLLHIACVVVVLEKAYPFGAMRKSRELLAGKFWAAAAVFVPLDGLFMALQVYFLVLKLEDLLSLAAGAAMAVALWAVVVVTLLAQPVVYMVCKKHHQEFVDKVHLNDVGEYQRLAVDGDSGVELQPVETSQTTPQPTATSAQASPQPAILPS